MRYRATVEATHSSTSIEGNPLNMKQVEKALSDLDGEPLTRHRYAEREVKNYKSALDFIEKRKQSGQPITMEDILVIHLRIMEDLLPSEKVGALRQNDVYITDSEGEIAYVGPSAQILPAELEELLAWLDAADGIHPVIVAAILHFHFVSIHPFADGNGRTTRALVALYLGLRDYDLRGALVLDSYYASDKPEYYLALDLAHDYQGRKAACLDPWLDYFADGFLSSAKVLQAEVMILSSVVDPAKSIKIAYDEIDLLSYAKRFGAVSLSEAESILPHLSRRTLQRKLKRLADDGRLVIKGTARTTRYEWKEFDSLTAEGESKPSAT